MSAPAPAPSCSSLKECSSCHIGRPESEFSGAQLKKKGKRVCTLCVDKKEIATSAAAELSAFTSRFATTTTVDAAVACAKCPSCDKKCGKVARCGVCKHPCCGVDCFTAHRDGPQCDAIRTMPLLAIEEEEDLLTTEEISVLWPQLLRRMIALSKSGPSTEEVDGSRCGNLSKFLEIITACEHHVTLTPLFIASIYPPRLTDPWWIPGSSGTLRSRQMLDFWRMLVPLVTALQGVYAKCRTISLPDPVNFANGSGMHHDQSAVVPASLDESRMLHRLMRYGLYYLRNVDPALLSLSQRQYMQVASDDYGVIPFSLLDDDRDLIHVLLYCSHSANMQDRKTLICVPINSAITPDRFYHGSEDLATFDLSMPFRNHELLLEQGLLVNAGRSSAKVCACSGYTGQSNSSFQNASVFYCYSSDDKLRSDLATITGPSSTGCSTSKLMAQGIVAELEARKQPGYFHLVPAMRAAIGEDDWPQNDGSLFIATPRRGLESELTELLLLEALVAEAAAGDVQAQLLIQNIEIDCGGDASSSSSSSSSSPTPIAKIIEVQRSRVDALSRDQREQLRIHADAVERHNHRCLLNSGASHQVTESFASASAIVSTSSSSSTEQAPVYSWTQSKAMQSLESLLTTGRQKYATIVKVGLKVLHSLNPSSVNRSGGSHLVFHYPVGSPVTLVLPHTGGGGSKDSTVSAQYCTRLYQRINEAIQQQIGGGSNPSGVDTLAPHRA